jgi:L-fuculose-phosphate aldolase
MAEVYYKCRCVGEPMLLSDDEVDVMLEKFQTYGQRK